MSLADRLFDLLVQWLEAPIIRQTAGEVARECREPLWEHVHGRIGGMTPAQARGYIRAIAPDFVCDEVDAVLSRRRASVYVRPRVIDQAVEGLLDLLADDILFAQRPRNAARLAA
jgi:hypothetical protein